MEENGVGQETRRKDIESGDLIKLTNFYYSHTGYILIEAGYVVHGEGVAFSLGNAPVLKNSMLAG